MNANGEYCSCAATAATGTTHPTAADRALPCLPNVLAIVDEDDAVVVAVVAVVYTITINVAVIIGNTIM